MAEYYIGDLAESDRVAEYKSQYVYTEQNKEGGPTPLKWVVGTSRNFFRICQKKKVAKGQKIKVIFGNAIAF